VNRMSNFDYISVSTTESAIEQLGSVRDCAKILAGGTDLLDELKEGLIRPERLVNLKANVNLRTIRFDSTAGLRLGALAILSDIEHHQDVAHNYPAVLEALGVLASPQIRNMATVGGNLCQRPRCWYYRDHELFCKRKGGPICYAVGGENAYHAILGGHACFSVHSSDLAPALMAYDAKLTYAGPAGRKTIALQDFFIGPDVDITRETLLQQNEVVEEVHLPPPGPGSRGVFLKVRDRNAWDFATLSVAAVLEMDGRTCRRARIVLGAVAPIPWPVPEADRVLSGAAITEKVAAEAAEAAVRGAQPMSTNAYKAPLAKRLVRRAILTAAGLSG
jgi:xanthine dehydrogenase YagS FAD-binding subunit